MRLAFHDLPYSQVAALRYFPHFLKLRLRLLLGLLRRLLFFLLIFLWLLLLGLLPRLLLFLFALVLGSFVCFEQLLERRLSMLFVQVSFQFEYHLVQKPQSRLELRQDILICHFYLY